MKPVIFMAVLDQASQDLLKKYAIHDQVYCHHMTMAFKPTDEQYRRLHAFVGMAFEGRVSWIIQNAACCAARIETNTLCLNKHPHVTISCGPDVKPVYSNTLLDLPATEVLEMPLLHPFEVRGVITEEPL